MLHGAMMRYELERDLFGWHAWRTAEYKPGTRLTDILGREPIALDPRAEIERKRRAARPPSPRALRTMAALRKADEIRAARGLTPPDPHRPPPG